MQETISAFASSPFIDALKGLFTKLQIPVSYIADKPARPQDILGDRYNDRSVALKLIDDVYLLGMVNDEAFNKSKSLFTEDVIDPNRLGKDYNGLLLFGIVLKRSALPTRTALAEITRAFNRAFPYLPVGLVFRYGSFMALANAERLAYKQQWREGEKVGKVSLLKDIKLSETHSGHLRILQDLAINSAQGVKPIHGFKTLYEHWQSVFSLQTLNKRFYNELFHWYLWAKQYIFIPPIPKGETQNEDTLTSIFTIRLLTRLLFIWFVKEKGLVPKAAFDEEHVANLLRKFDPSGEDDVKQGAREGSYYKAILQNLFFATLNTPMDKDAESKRERRQFLDPTDKAYSDEYLDQTKYRYANLLKDEDALKALFKDVPFLNGGLFECLDSRTEDGTERRYDGFSSNVKKQPTVPDFLFFSPTVDADVTKDFEEDKAKKKRIVQVRGLIHILSSYVFTIAENTPLEEEIALDPELLGKVFENLLASYNPETKSTARKQTGSFYTPREIVSYMVDESLKAYLLQKLCDRTGAYLPAGQDQTDMFGNSSRKGQLKIEESLRHVPTAKETKVWEDNLANLFGDTWTENPFSSQDCNLLITALSNCRILDPACGSGAFPMGILQRTTALLSRLDPNNRAWKQAQLAKAKADKKTAESLQDATLREKALKAADDRIAYIERSFDVARDEFDFTRKLFLIENCIYGVDIQQIAVQIAKLRFFISLMAEQTVNDEKPNRNILSLPNLETKFVAGNTLIGLSRRDGMIIHPDVLKVEGTLRTVRRQIFYTRRYRDKKKLRNEEATQRELLKTALLKSGFGEADAELATRWDPFDQMHAAPFYDSEMMFGFGKGEGFDVVIGNPPYVRADAGGDFALVRKRITESNNYKTLYEKWDLYIPFIEQGVNLLGANGISTMIVADAYCHAKYAIRSQDWAINKLTILRLDFLRDIQVFEAAVRNVIYFFKKATNPTNLPERRLHLKTFGHLVSLPTMMQKDADHRLFFPEDTIASDFSVPTTLLSDLCYLSVGMVCHAHEDKAPGEFKLEDLISLTKDKTHPKPFVEGKDLARWLPARHKWLEWGTTRAPSKFRRETFPELYSVPEKLFILRIGGSNLAVCFDDKQLLCNHTTIIAVPWVSLKNVNNLSIKKAIKDLSRTQLEKNSQRYSVKFLLAIMNSSAAKNFLRSNRRSNTDLYPDDWKNLPIPVADSKSQAPIITLVNCILSKRKAGEGTSAEESKIDCLVSELYGLNEEDIPMVESKTK